MIDRATTSREGTGRGWRTFVQPTDMNGVVFVDKPAGISSFTAVQQVRRQLGVGGRRGVKAGHAGTLDPFATGLLVVALGRATRLLKWSVGHDKRYLVDVVVGARSSTDDVTGDLTDRVSAPPVDEIEAAVAEVALRIEQVPCAVSAIHVDGVRAYARVRRGEDLQLAPRAVAMDIAIESYDRASGILQLDVRCSAGAYMRALARDIGDILDIGGYAGALRRIEVGAWSVDDAAPIEVVTAGSILPMDELVADQPATDIAAYAPPFTCGQHVPVDAALEGSVRVLGDGRLLGIGVASKGVLRPDVVLVDPLRGEPARDGEHR